MRAARRAGRAFTLIEIVLTISLMLMLMGVFVFGHWGIRSEYLDQGTYRFETVLRMARAEAAYRGRRMRLQFGTSTQTAASQAESAGQFMIMWEPQPLAQPGQFIAYQGGVWARNLPSDMVAVVRCRRVGASAHDVLTYDQNLSMDQDPQSEALQNLDFYPDGSSDSAFIELQSRDLEDLRGAIIELDGINGIIKTSVMGSTQLQEYYEQKQIEAPQGNSQPSSPSSRGGY